MTSQSLGLSRFHFSYDYVPIIFYENNSVSLFHIQCVSYFRDGDTEIHIHFGLTYDFWHQPHLIRKVLNIILVLGVSIV